MPKEKHAGLLRVYRGRKTVEIQRALRSYERQVALYQRKLVDPGEFIKEWQRLSVQEQHRDLV